MISDVKQPPFLPRVNNFDDIENRNNGGSYGTFSSMDPLAQVRCHYDDMSSLFQLSTL